MAVLVTSGNPLGLRVLGSGGRTAVASYGQIVRLLRDSLGSDHAELFCEPNMRAGAIDWFTSFEATSKPIRLTQAPPTQRQACGERLQALMRDIEAQAVLLQKSDRQDERILGDMLAFALEVPDESAVFAVGTRPVLTFWGHVRDQGRPAENPLHALVRRLSASTQAPATPAAAGEGARSLAGPAEAPASLPGQAALPPAVAAKPEVGQPLIGPALWMIFTALLLTIGVLLLKGCALGLPSFLTGWILNYCVAPGDGRAGAALASEQTKQALLQAEFDELVREAELKRQACIVRPPPVRQAAPTPPSPPSPPPVPPAPPQKPDEKLRLPVRPTKDTSFLQGCWITLRSLNEYKNDKPTGLTVTVTFCFNADGSGIQKIRYDKDGAQCRGKLRSEWRNDKIVIDADEAVCEGQHGAFSAGTVTCRRSDSGDAVCDATYSGKTEPSFTDFPFIRTTTEP